jgi:hypothetical protein
MLKKNEKSVKLNLDFGIKPLIEKSAVLSVASSGNDDVC